MTPRKQTCQPKLEALESREVLSRAPLWNLAMGYNDHGHGVVRYVQSPTTTYTFDTGDTLHFNATDGRYDQELRVAVGDVNHDGTPDIITANGPQYGLVSSGVLGNGPSVFRVFDGATVASGHPREIAKATLPWRVGGSFLACGDLDGDGYADVVAGRDWDDGTRGHPTGTPSLSPPNGANLVAIYSGRVLAGTPSGTNPASAAVFSGITDPNWHGGSTVALGDVNGDRTPELVVGAGYGGGPRVAVWDGVGILDVKTRRKVCNDFFGWDAAHSGGITVAAADMNRDGYAEIYVSPSRALGPSEFTPLIQVFDGHTVATEGISALNQSTLLSGGRGTPWGVRLAVKDFDGDSNPDLAFSYESENYVVQYKGIGQRDVVQWFDRLDPFPDPRPHHSGVWVG